MSAHHLSSAAGHVLPSLEGSNPPSAANRSSTCSMAIGGWHPWHWESEHILWWFFPHIFVLYPVRLRLSRLLLLLHSFFGQFCHNFVTHTSLSHTTLSHTTLSHTNWNAQTWTHSNFIHNSFTHTTLSYTILSHNHFHTFCHTQLFYRYFFRT